MDARGDLLPRTAEQALLDEQAENFRRLLRRTTPPIETLRLIPGTARWAYEHARRGLPVPRVQPPIEQLLEIKHQNAV